MAEQIVPVSASTTPPPSQTAWRWFRVLYWVNAGLALISIVFALLIIFAFSDGGSGNSHVAGPLMYASIVGAGLLGMVIAVYQWAKAGKQFVYVFLCAPLLLFARQFVSYGLRGVSTLSIFTLLFVAVMIGQVVTFYQYSKAREIESNVS